MWQLWIMLADGDPPKTGLSPIEMVLFLVVFPLILMYFLMIRPGQKRQDQERVALLSGLKKNDRVLTTAGIYGTVVAISEKEDEVTVRVDDNVRIKMLKGSIARNLTNEEAVKAEKAAKEGKKEDTAKAAKEGKKEGAADDRIRK
jgi:preprotein translocase subunit YajC